MSETQTAHTVRIQEDRWAIQQILCRWCELVDAHRWDDMAEVFTEDVVGVYNGKEVPGLRTLIDSGNANMTRDTIARTQHNVLNFRIDIDGDEAHCVTNYYAVHLGAGEFKGEIYSMWGEYDDRLRRTPAGWRIHRRDYATFFVEGDDRMTFGGEEPDWEKSYRD
jgi:3-phenylpropionate/cinnamic acid dioxygenase small subunit